MPPNDGAIYLHREPRAQRRDRNVRPDASDVEFFRLVTMKPNNAGTVSIKILCFGPELAIGPRE